MDDLNVQKKGLNVNKREPQDIEKALPPGPNTTCANASAFKAL
jgi:hypothetical protein